MKALGGKFEIGVSREGMFWILVIKFVFFLPCCHSGRVLEWV